jgi:hypothetical protein
VRPHIYSNHLAVSGRGRESEFVGTRIRRRIGTKLTSHLVSMNFRF